MNEFIFGFGNLKELGDNNKNFPFAKVSMVPPVSKNNELSFKCIKELILFEFQDILCDTLPDKPLKGPPMKIELLPNVIPKCFTYTKSVPLHKQQCLKELMDQAVKDGVITHVEGPTEWLSPAFLVPKSNGGDRIVVDLSCLNKFIKRPTHPFPTGQEIAVGLSSKSRYFCKMDAVQSYWQVGLDEKSSYLTSFLLPCGR